MGKLAEAAVNNHRNGHSCSGSLLCAFADAAGLSLAEANRLSGPIAGGRQGKCGAVLAAECVLEAKYGKLPAEAKKEQLEAEFIAKNQSDICRVLRGRRLRPCRGCIQDAAEILERMLDDV